MLVRLAGRHRVDPDTRDSVVEVGLLPSPNMMHEQVASTFSSPAPVLQPVLQCVHMLWTAGADAILIASAKSFSVCTSILGATAFSASD